MEQQAILITLAEELCDERTLDRMARINSLIGHGLLRPQSKSSIAQIIDYLKHQSVKFLQMIGVGGQAAVRMPTAQPF